MEEAMPQSWRELQDHLVEVADGLRDVEHIDPQARRELADLLDELSEAIATTKLPAQDVEHLVATTTHVAKSLQHPATHGVVSSAVERLEHAVLSAQSRAPVLAGITRRLIDVLSSIGI